jgi:glycosyltransferase involved in cell wall biosynthesis
VLLLMRELRELGVEQLGVVPAGSQLEARLRTDDLPVHGVGASHGGVRFSWAAGRLSRGADLVHTHDAGALAAGRWVSRLRRIPHVAACRVLAPRAPHLWSAAARIVAVSEIVREALVAAGVDPFRITVIHSGIDADEVRRLPPMVPPLRDRIAFPPERFLAGAIGSLHDFRNQRLVPQAAARARDIAWVVVGEGPERTAIEAAIAAHGVEENVRLMGAIADPRTALRELDVLVAPSEGEALGTGILEAMALDVPVFAAEDAGPAEILGPVHLETGVSFFPPGDAAALAAGVLRLAREPHLRKVVTASQRKRVADFSIETTVKATVALYHELARSPR